MLYLLHRAAKLRKINRLNGPSTIHENSTWLNQSIQSVMNVCCESGMQLKSTLKVLQISFRPFKKYGIPSTLKFLTLSLTHAQTLSLAVHNRR